MAESRKRANDSVAEEVDCKIVRVELANGQLVSQQQIKLEPLSPAPYNIINQPPLSVVTIKEEPLSPTPVVNDNEVADDDEPVRGIEEFNPNYLKREPTSPSSVVL